MSIIQLIMCNNSFIKTRISELKYMDTNTVDEKNAIIINSKSSLKYLAKSFILPFDFGKNNITDEEKTKLINTYRLPYESSFFNTQNTYFKFKTKTKRYEIVYNSRNYGFDTFKPQYIIFKNKNNIVCDIQEFINNVKEYKYTMSLSWCNITFNFSFLIELNNIMVIDNSYILMIPYDSFFQLPIKIISMQYHDICCYIDVENNFLDDFDISQTIETEICSTIVRNILKDESLTNISYFNELMYIDQLNDVTEYSFTDKYFNGLLKGIFIESNINDITKIKIEVAMYDIFQTLEEYDKIKIHMKCLKISNSLLYINFDNNKNYNDPSPLNSMNALFLSRSFILYSSHINLKITISFQKKANIKLYYLALNTFVHHSGMLSIYYSM